MKFEELNFGPAVMEGLSAMGFENATPVQAETIPIILEGKDIIGCAQTGTGKTAAYLLPILNKLATSGNDEHNVDAIILAPTRELAVQIDRSLAGFAYFTNTSSLAIYGGTDGASFEREKKALKEGADIVIATPGRLIMHLNMGYVKLDNLSFLVLDEADRMLDMGFLGDLMKIISFLPEERQTLMFSATMPPKIRSLAEKILKEPEQVNLAVSKPAEGVFQGVFLAHDDQKIELIKHLLSAKEIPSIIIFSSTKANVKAIDKELRKANFNARSIHSDLEQTEREEVLLKFRNRQVQILVATDVMSRGIDIENIGLVINYDVPHDGEDYVHRVGRTARAESTGVAFTFVNSKDQQKFYRIEETIGMEVRRLKLPEHLGEPPSVQKPRKGGQGGGSRRKGGGRKGGQRKGRPGRSSS
ncbi:DEAD/DEAH box helicase [Roseivirga sp. BDSF3-8]|uniref:DEAD/DEAH box helicase n=1 Tax=Roseivirga sp. BDSF3-8 TaxID=3241598 RepID=UPI003531A156